MHELIPAQTEASTCSTDKCGAASARTRKKNAACMRHQRGKLDTTNYNSELNITCCSADVNACETASGRTPATDSSSNMRRENLEFNTGSYNATISACEKASEKNAAFDLSSLMRYEGMESLEELHTPRFGGSESFSMQPVGMITCTSSLAEAAYGAAICDCEKRQHIHMNLTR